MPAKPLEGRMKIELHRFVGTSDWELLLSTSDGDMVAAVSIPPGQVAECREANEHVLMAKFLKGAGVDESCIIDVGGQ